MRFSSMIVGGVLFCGYAMVTSEGCQTESPGATDTLGSYSTMMDGAPDKVAIAAQKAAGDLNLTDIVQASSKVDGKVTAKDAQGDAVIIDIAQAGDKVSKVSIRVGVTGDEAVSKQLIDKIKTHMP